MESMKSEQNTTATESQSQECSTNSPKRTLSRELSLLLFIHLVYLSVEAPEAFSSAVWPYITFWVYAFGSKQKVVSDLIDSRLKQGDKL